MLSINYRCDCLTSVFITKNINFYKYFMFCLRDVFCVAYLKTKILAFYNPPIDYIVFFLICKRM